MILKISQLLRIFYAPSNDKKGIKKKEKYIIQYAILTLLLHYS